MVKGLTHKTNACVNISTHKVWQSCISPVTKKWSFLSLSPPSCFGGWQHYQILNPVREWFLHGVTATLWTEYKELLIWAEFSHFYDVTHWSSTISESIFQHMCMLTADKHVVLLDVRYTFLFISVLLNPHKTITSHKTPSFQIFITRKEVLMSVSGVQ